MNRKIEQNSSPNIFLYKPDLTGITIPHGIEDTLVKAQQWLKNNPKSHKPYRKTTTDGKVLWVDQFGEQVKRSVSREREQISHYLIEIARNDPYYMAQLLALEQGVHRMHDRLRVAVTIPSWGEEKSIYHTLNEYTHQTDKNGKPLDPKLYSLNVLINRRVGEIADDTVAQIEKFKEETKEKSNIPQINFLDVQFFPPYNNVGSARSLINNLQLLLSVRRDHQESPLYIESEDADLMRVDPHTIINLITTMDKNPHLDAVLGKQDKYPPILMQNDYLFVARRLREFAKILASKRNYHPDQNINANFVWNRIYTGGYDTGISAEAYALVGGYDPLMSTKEDLSLGIRITMARGNGELPNTDVIGRVSSRIDSSPRRYIWGVISRRSLYKEGFMDQATNEMIKNQSLEDLLEQISPLSRINSENQRAFEIMMTNIYRFVQKIMPDPEEAKQNFQHMLHLVGFRDSANGSKPDYKISLNGNVRILNFENAKRLLEAYRQENG